MTADREQAAADLAALDRDRATLAEQVVQPWWFDAALGLLLFGFLAAQALDSRWVTAPALPAYLLSGQDHRWALVVAGAVLGLAVALLSRRWGRAWQRELREGV